MTRIRTFIALDPGKAIRERLVSLQQDLARSATDVKWVEPENLHITLLFLGEVDDRELPAVCQAVTSAAKEHVSFAASIEGAGAFPNPRRPRTLWVGFGAGLQETVTLHDALEKPLLNLGCYRREERAYTPHITLGRVRTEPPLVELTAALTKLRAWKAGETMIREVHVMSSELGPKGPTYAVLSRAKLG